jgi:serine phosphatase RsbU (regulator of sigma subunit)
LFNIKDYYNSGKLNALKFNLQENFNANLITTTSNFTDKNGNLYFGTDNGIIKFNFSQALAKKQVLKIYLSNILLNYEKVNWENLNFKSVNNIPISPKFEYFQNNITFQLSNLNFFNSNNTLFQFKLIGLDKSFTKPSKTNQINYSNLPFGKYEFVAKAHRDGFEKTSDILFYRFEILPAFYQTLWFKLLVIVLIGVIVVLIFKYRTMQIKAKNKMLEKMVDQKTELLNVKITEVTELYNQIKSKNLTINESIEYAKYIQDSILKLNRPTTINSNIEINELIYLPKDTIGGDFYMIFNHNDLNYIVLADCTGHGVPGALLTVLSKSLLNQIVLYDNILEPHLILEKLNELFWNTFKNSNNTTETSSDSLSVSVLVLDYKNNILVCSNSQMPFFMKSKNEIIEVKTKSSPINVNPLIAKYDSESYNISDIESILLYSDGIIDQKGGVNSKKLYTAGLKKWLINENGSGYYLKKLEEFKNNNSQRDDIMLINIKLRNT